MNQSRYSEYSSSALILRDHLAIERTNMANERTLLAYVRTMVGIIAVGGSLLKLFNGWIYLVSGWALIACGGVLLILGFVRYTRIYTILHSIIESDKTDKSDWMHQTLGLLLEKLHLAKLKS